MKFSVFNTYLPLSERIGVIYNSLLDKAVFTPLTSEDFSLIDFEKCDALIRATAFVEDTVDEYQLYLDEMLAHENNELSYHLMINPTLDCIFNCWYCYERHSKGYMDSDIINRVYKLIENLFSKYGALTISFFGGEPMMYYNQVILPIVKYAHSQSESKGKRFSFNMTTNGYLFNQSRIDEMKKYGFTSAQITIDGNREKHNKTRFLAGGLPTYERIVENIIKLANSGRGVTVRLNCTHENVYSFEALPDDLQPLTAETRKNISIDCHIVWQEGDKDDLQKKQHELVAHFKKHNLRASKMDFRQFCYADRRTQCLINYNGDVYKCTAVDFENVTRDGYINETGEIIWENDSLELRMQSKQRNERCKSCSVLPLCHGGCSSRSLESSDYCLYPEKKQREQLVINRLEHIITLLNEK